MKNTLLHLTGAAVLAFAFIGSAHTMLGQASGQTMSSDLGNVQSKSTGKTDTKDADAPAAKEKPKATEQAQKGNQQSDVSPSEKAEGKINTSKAAGDGGPTDITKRNTKVVEKSDRQTNPGQSQQKQSTTVVVQGTQANHYNNQWVAASTHSDWDVNINHNWNNHDYRYYDGGWLIITNSEAPGYYESGALVIRVKQGLAQQGYYKGHLTETIGPHTRQAISNYESDKGLQVNGQIDDPLLASLGIE